MIPRFDNAAYGKEAPPLAERVRAFLLDAVSHAPLHWVTSPPLSDFTH